MNYDNNINKMENAVIKFLLLPQKQILLLNIIFINVLMISDKIN